MYKCKTCGYLYDPEQGDVHSGVEPGTLFENLPASWRCPVCNVSTDDFEPYEE